MGILKREGWRPLVDKCAPHVAERYRGSIFAVATDFVFADGTVEQEEEEVISHLQKALGIDEGLARNVIEVMALKNAV